MALVFPFVVNFSRLIFQAAFFFALFALYTACTGLFCLPMCFPLADFFGVSRAVLAPVWMLYNSFHIHFFTWRSFTCWEILSAGRFCLSEYGSGRGWKILEMEDFPNFLLVGISRIFQVKFCQFAHDSLRFQKFPTIYNIYIIYSFAVCIYVYIDI